MAKSIKYKIGDKAELKNDTGKYDVLGQIPESRVGDVHMDNNNSPLVGEREHVTHTVVETLVAGINVLEAEDLSVHSSSPTRSNTRGLDVREKRFPKSSMIEMFIM